MRVLFSPFDRNFVNSLGTFDFGDFIVIVIGFSVNGLVKTRFVAVDNVIRPNATQLTDLVLRILKELLVILNLF